MSSVPSSMPCSKCGVEYPLTSEFFIPTKANRYGLSGQCRKCINQREKERYWENPELARSKARKKYKNNPEPPKQRRRDYYKTPHGKVVHNASSREWRKNNPDKVKASKKRDYEKHKPKRLATMRRNYPKHKAATMLRAREWAKRNPEKVKANTLKRIIRKRNLPMNYRASDWIIALEYFGYKCAVCGYDCSSPQDDRVFAQDHWIPMEYKGADNPGTVPANIVPLCHGTGGCNNLKHDFMPDVYLRKYFDDDKANEILKRITEYFEWVKSRS